jgi:hypothetical protein
VFGDEPAECRRATQTPEPAFGEGHVRQITGGGWRRGR